MARDRFILLDPQRSMKTELTTADVETFIQNLRERGAARSEHFFNPQFEYSYDEDTEWHELAGERLVYRAKGIEPELPGAADRYRFFADWYAQLSALRPGNMPPFGRMELNKLLAEKGLIPEDVERVVTIANVFPPKKIEARSHHLVNWRLSDQDHKQIRKVGDQIQSLSAVTVNVYFELDKLADNE
jgi:hypothetical protein